MGRLIEKYLLLASKSTLTSTGRLNRVTKGKFTFSLIKTNKLTQRGVLKNT